MGIGERNERNGGENAGNQGGNAGNRDENAGNLGRNVGNRGGNAIESNKIKSNSLFLLKLKKSKIRIAIKC